MSIIIPKLGLHDINDGDLLEYTQDKIAKVGGNAAFAAVSPSVMQLNAKENQYNQALTASDDGNKAQTATKNTRRKELERMLTQQAENCAEIANGDLDLYLTTGYEAKDIEGTAVGVLDQVLNLRMHPTETLGEMDMDWDLVEHAKNYTVRCYTDEMNPESSTIASKVFSPSKGIINQLPSGERVFVQVQANGGSTGTGAWSEPSWDRPK